MLGPRAAVRLSAAERRTERERAREVVARWGGGTLDYFALRDDKDFFFAEDGVVAHSVRNGVCLVSPDPIGPPDRRGALLTEFLGHVERHGWSVAVVGAGTEWLPLYEATGLRPVYLGDEAVLDCQSFSLQGKAMKSLRGAVNRVQKAGVTVTFHDGPSLTDAERADLEGLSGDSRRGEAERGYSMTLSRMFDPADTGVLVSVARFADGRAAGFVQWVPAAAVDGYSLDVMRRSTAEDVPNGLTDLLIVATAQHLAERGMRGLGLNFAVLREVVAGEREGRGADLGRRALHALSHSAQIESLWRFNAKYDPQWVPRYVVLDSVEFSAAQGLTIAGAEGLADLPVVGRFLGARTAATAR
nr:phosphatidylglycerol lysyltransferase domain-containing protein [Kineococcus siccus]